MVGFFRDPDYGTTAILSTSVHGRRLCVEYDARRISASCLKGILCLHIEDEFDLRVLERDFFAPSVRGVLHEAVDAALALKIPLSGVLEVSVEFALRPQDRYALEPRISTPFPHTVVWRCALQPHAQVRGTEEFDSCWCDVSLGSTQPAPRLSLHGSVPADRSSGLRQWAQHEQRELAGRATLHGYDAVVTLKYSPEGRPAPRTL